ncbi:MAG: FG-GAP repeat protein [Deltaproteobacteria bacterium]|nr:FG-GAP repeat protein [Deltaproteobacteria bacterium]
MLRALLLASALLLPACGDPDRDGDGYSPADGDCNDDDSLIHPSADEICDGVDNDCNGSVDDDAVDAPTWYTDSDGDSFGDPATAFRSCEAEAGELVENGLDCDDDDRDISPLALEYCDGIDNDCNDVIDDDYAEDALTWYVDADEDGYGNPGYTTEACDLPDGYVANHDDCDDGEGAAWPGNDEVCDGIDNDCNGMIDDGPLDPVAWYRDADEDGYGDPKDTILTCTPPEGYVADGTDCDDGDATVHPDAPEYCDTIDNDCDGFVDEDGLDPYPFYLDADGDGFGDPAITVEDCAPPEGYADNPDDCDDTDPAVHPGADEMCNGYDDDCDAMVDEDAVDAPTWYYDSDGDGYGNPLDSVVACDAPRRYVADATDCNDLDRSSYPGAPETCDGEDNDCDGSTDEDAVDASTFWADADGDGYGDAAVTVEACDIPEGYASNDDDCDDTNADVFPGADEYCNGYDDDCDDDVDEATAVDATTWYLDYDSDGYGSSEVTRIACDEPSGYVSNADDCNDRRADIYPDAPEYCDDDDNDCDGEVDEGTPLDAETWYADTDGDGYGDPDTSTVSCDRPAGFEDNGDDCDDSDGNVFPGANEYCNGYDDDCDGEVDERSALDVTAWYLDNDGDGYGNSAYVTYACDEPDGYGPEFGDCDDTDPAIHPGATEVCDYDDNDCDGVVDESDAVDADTWYVDADEDGYGDPDSTTRACTQPEGYVSTDSDCDDSDATTHPGAEEICNDGVDNDCDDAFGACVMDLDAADAIFVGETYADYAGGSVAAGSDIDGDGYDDLLIGAEYRDDGTATDAGATYLFYGPISAGTIDLSLADNILVGEAASDQSSTDLSISGDVNGDAIADLLISGKRNAAGIGSSTGAAYLFWGPVSATATSLLEHDVKISGNSTWDYTGINLEFAGDLNNDGYDDVLVGANADDAYGANAGTVYVKLGPITADLSVDSADYTFGGETAYDAAGIPASGGDVDGDGCDDLLVGVPNQDLGGATTDAGAVYLMYAEGLASGSLGSVYDVHFYGSDGDRLGARVGPGGDLDDDGYDDILMSATLADGGANNGGALYVVYGPVAAGSYLASTASSMTFYGDEANGQLGGSVDGAYDYDEDGAVDLLASGQYTDANTGWTYLFLSPAEGTWYGSDADATWRGEEDDDYAGGAAAFAGNIEGAGTMDAVLIGAKGNDRGGAAAGAAYLVYGRSE